MQTRTKSKSITSSIVSDSTCTASPIKQEDVTKPSRILRERNNDSQCSIQSAKSQSQNSKILTPLREKSLRIRSNSQKLNNNYKLAKRQDSTSSSSDHSSTSGTGSKDIDNTLMSTPQKDSDFSDNNLQRTPNSRSRIIKRDKIIIKNSPIRILKRSRSQQNLRREITKKKKGNTGNNGKKIKMDFKIKQFLEGYRGTNGFEKDLQVFLKYVNEVVEWKNSKAESQKMVSRESGLDFESESTMTDGEDNNNNNDNNHNKNNSPTIDANSYISIDFMLTRYKELTKSIIKYALYLDYQYSECILVGLAQLLILIYPENSSLIFRSCIINDSFLTKLSDWVFLQSLPDNVGDLFNRICQSNKQIRNQRVNHERAQAYLIKNKNINSSSVDMEQHMISFDANKKSENKNHKNICANFVETDVNNFIKGHVPSANHTWPAELVTNLDLDSNSPPVNNNNNYSEQSSLNLDDQNEFCMVPNQEVNNQFFQNCHNFVPIHNNQPITYYSYPGRCDSMSPLNVVTVSHHSNPDNLNSNNNNNHNNNNNLVFQTSSGQYSPILYPENGSLLSPSDPCLAPLPNGLHSSNSISPNAFVALKEERPNSNHDNNNVDHDQLRQDQIFDDIRKDVKNFQQTSKGHSLEDIEIGAINAEIKSEANNNNGNVKQEFLLSTSTKRGESPTITACINALEKQPSQTDKNSIPRQRVPNSMSTNSHSQLISDLVDDFMDEEGMQELLEDLENVNDEFEMAEKKDKYNNPNHHNKNNNLYMTSKNDEKESISGDSGVRSGQSFDNSPVYKGREGNEGYQTSGCPVNLEKTEWLGWFFVSK